MPDALPSLLARLTGYSDGELAWPRVIQVHNNAPLPVCEHDTTDHVVNRGFNLLLLDRRGRATHFCKCRPLHDEATRREGSLLQYLTDLGTLDDILPRTRVGVTGQVRVLVSDNADGALLEKAIPGFDERAWTAAVEGTLVSMERITAAAAGWPEAERRDGAPASLGDRLAVGLARLDDAGVDPAHVAALAEAVDRAPALPSVPQHGDLWGRNVVGHGRGWWIIDLERFGEIDVPLYDAFHLVRTASLAWEPTWRGSFVTLLDAGGRVSSAARRVIARRAAVHGITGAGLAAVYVFYLVDIIGMMLRRAQFSDAARRRILDEVAELAERSRSPEALAATLAGAGSAA